MEKGNFPYGIEAYIIFMNKMMEMKMKKMEAELMALKENKDHDRELVTIFNSLKKQISGKMVNKGNSLFLECFGLCNSIIKIGKKIVGDPIEVEMFENSLFELKHLPKFRLVPRLDDQSIQNKELVKYFIPNREGQSALGERLYQQTKKFDFSNKTKRMTVVSTKFPHSENIKELFAKGESYKDAARTLGISPLTVGNHVKSIYRKLAVHSRGEAVYEAIKTGQLSI